MKLNPLLVSPSPRDIPEVTKALETIHFVDKLYIKYVRPEYRAYQFIQTFFLEAIEDYTHLMICPDDLLITAENITQILRDIDIYDYEVIGGVCNLDLDWNADLLIIGLEPIPPVRSDRTRFFQKADKYFNYDGQLQYDYKQNPIIRTMWQGFPLTTIRRDVLEEITFRNDAEYNNLPIELGCCIDDVFCWDLIKHNIQSFTDLRIRMIHLKRNQQNAYLQPLDKTPRMIFIPRKI